MSGQHAEGLPQVAVEAGLADLVLQDEVALRSVSRRSFVASPPTTRIASRGRGTAGARRAARAAQLCADRRDLVLEQRRSGSTSSN
jgi:hypothetical protein